MRRSMRGGDGSCIKEKVQVLPYGGTQLVADSMLVSTAVIGPG